jgi:MraZ protein
MLIGEYGYNIDSKGRLNFPAKLREDMGERFILSKGLGSEYLCAYPMEEWRLKRERLKQLPAKKVRELQRFLFSSATVAEPDSQGRIVIPQNLREYAGLSREVVVVGADDRCEIWDKLRWDELSGQMSAKVNALIEEDELDW